MMHNTLYLNDVTLIAPGVDDWAGFTDLLHSGQTLLRQDQWKAAPACLTPRSQRRLSPQTLLAIAVAEQLEPALADNAAWVFASAFGEGETLKVILDALRTPEMAIRPLRFQNSVHNAASGQWTIAASIQSAATSLCAGECTVGAGFLKSTLQATLENRPVGLVLYDVPLPFPLSTSHRLTMPAGVGFALSPTQLPNAIATLDICHCRASPSPVVTEVSQAALKTQNPVFAALPLLERLAGIGEGDVILGLNGGSSLCIKVRRL